jgi:hypothetical protein
MYADRCTLDIYLIRENTEYFPLLDVAMTRQDFKFNPNCFTVGC